MAGGEINYTPFQPEESIEIVSSNCDSYKQELRKYDWDPELMSQIMSLESGCNPVAKNDNPNTRDYSIGLMQINLFGANAKHRPDENWLKVPKNNIAFAYELYSNGGYGHWTTYQKALKML